MRRHRFTGRAAGALTVICAAFALSAVPAAAQAGGDGASLEAQMGALVARLGTMGADDYDRLLPREGTVRYTHTRHTRTGDSVGVWILSPDELRRAANAEGPLYEVFNVDAHGQAVGTLSHRAFTQHRRPWRRVRGARFVPPGASAGSATYVEWRREGDRWVIAAFGDESFPNGVVPPWCC